MRLKVLVPRFIRSATMFRVRTNNPTLGGKALLIGKVSSKMSNSSTLMSRLKPKVLKAAF